MPHPVVEQNILRSGGGVAKSVTDIKAKTVTVHRAGTGAPVPGVVIGPHAATPVQSAVVRSRVKGIDFAVKLHLATGTHTIDLLIIVERVRVLQPGRGDHHGVLEWVL